MTTRKSYNAMEADYRARVRTLTPDLAALLDEGAMIAELEREREDYAREAAAGADEGEDATDLG